MPLHLTQGTNTISGNVLLSNGEQNLLKVDPTNGWVTIGPDVPPAGEDANIGLYCIRNLDSYSGINICNYSTGTSASTDIVAVNTDGGVDPTIGFIDLGINGKNNADSNFAVFDAGCGYLWTSDSNLYIGTQSNSDGLNQGDINFFTGGTDNKNLIRVNIAKAGPVTFQNGATVTAPNFISNVAIGTQPYSTTSTTVNTNLNADMLDGKHTGTTGNTVPLLDGSNTHSGTNKFGDGTNYVQIDGSGELSLVGTATVFQDANVGGLVLRTGGTAPGVVQILDNDGDNTGIYTVGFDVNEEGSGVIEIPHDYKEGSNITFHIHWGANDAPADGTDNVKWQLTYSIARAVNTFPDSITPTAVEVAYTTQYQYMFTDIATITGTTGGVDGGNIKIGDQFHFSIKRIAASADEFGGEALMGTLGLHYECDTMGSKTISAK